MNIENLVNENAATKKKYAYFKSLGYGEKAAQLLAILRYGDHDMCAFLKDFDEEARLDKLYAWLLERPEKDPMQAFRNEMYKVAPEIREEAMRGAAPAGFGALGSALASIPNAFAGAMKMAMPASGGIKNLSKATAREGRAMPEPMMDMACAVEEAICEDVEEGLVDAAALSENLATDSYALIEEKDAKNVLTSPTSTFRMTTTTASMGILLNQIRSGRRIDLSQVRIEEVLNYFAFDHGAWEEDAKFRISTERLPKSNGKELLYINVESSDRAKEHQNVILLLDVSGSMSSQSDVTLETLATVVSKLKEGDVLSLVTYSTSDATIFADRVIAGQGEKEDIMGRILGIEITGCTYGSKGIETAYELGKKVYKENWSNQVILITDGDLNFGITEKGGLQDLIEEKKRSGLFLSVIGTGLYNYQDEKLEVLSKHGNGTYCVINSLEDVDYSVNKHYVSLTNVVAKDVKAQVEFNPKFVKTYRLLGYENRALSHEDFKNDKVISEPYGSGGHGVAVYELVMGDATQEQELKYQQALLVPSTELCTVKVRFKEPLGEQSEEIAQTVDAPNAKEAGKNVKLAYFLYVISEKLRGSERLDDADQEFFKKTVEKHAYKEWAGEGSEALELLLQRLN